MKYRTAVEPALLVLSEAEGSEVEGPSRSRARGYDLYSESQGESQKGFILLRPWIIISQVRRGIVEFS